MKLKIGQTVVRALAKRVNVKFPTLQAFLQHVAKINGNVRRVNRIDFLLNAVEFEADWNGQDYLVEVEFPNKQEYDKATHYKGQ
jgi:hypothetical protein